MTAEGRATVVGTAWDDVRRLPILLAHHYHRVDADQVWSSGLRDAAFSKWVRPGWGVVRWESFCVPFCVPPG